MSAAQALPSALGPRRTCAGATRGAHGALHLLQERLRALEVEGIALEEKYFRERNLCPNVDFYSGIIYQAVGLPVEMFPLLFANPRTVGRLAPWEEMLRDGGTGSNRERTIARSRQV